MSFLFLLDKNHIFFYYNQNVAKKEGNICNWFIMQLTKKKKKWLKGISGDIYFWMILQLYYYCCYTPFESHQRSISIYLVQFGPFRFIRSTSV